jgi:hypothetical protein
MPIKTFYPSGATMFDSDAVSGGVCLGSVYIAAGSSYSKSWPWLAGATVRVTDVYGVPITATGVGTVTTSDSPYPSVSIGAAAHDHIVLLWATGTTGITNSPGIQAASASGTIALHPSARGLNYVGQAVYESMTPAFYDSGTGQKTLAYWTVRAPASFTSSMPPVPVFDLSSGYYTAGSAGFFWDSGYWRCYVYAYSSLPTSANAASLTAQTPAIYLFGKPPSAPTTGPIFALYDTDGTLAYDLLAGPLLASKASLSYSSSTVSLSAPSATKLGVFGDPAMMATERIEFEPQTTLEIGYWRSSGGALTRSRGFFETSNDGDAADSSTYDFWTLPTRAECFDLAGY